MGIIQDKIYPKLPLPLQNLAISAYGYKWNKRRFGGEFDEEYKGFKERENFTQQQWNDYQTLKLRELLIHSIENVPYYREYFKKAGFTKEDFFKFELADLSKLPFLEKDTLRALGKTELVATKTEAGGEFYGSSGSTGTPTQILFSLGMHQRWSAGFEARIRNWAGLSRFNPRGMIGGRRVIQDGVAKPPYYRYNFIERQVYFSAYHISKNTAESYMEGIRKYNLDYMTGYAVSNFVLARFFDELNLSTPLKAVITSSEKLTQEMRDVFSRVYRCKTYDSYSGVEACGLISECEMGGLHVSPDMGIIEFINSEGKQAKPGELAEIVSTGILNYDQPLIRYRIGDMAVLSHEKCSCGRDMPLVTEIVGRLEDVVVGNDGREMVRFHGIFINLPSVLKAQVIQENYGEFTIKIQPLQKITDKEKEIIKSRMESQLGEISLTIEEVDEMPIGPNGKFKSVISKVKRK